MYLEKLEAHPQVGVQMCADLPFKNCTLLGICLKEIAMSLYLKIFPIYFNFFKALKGTDKQNQEE